MIPPMPDASIRDILDAAAAGERLGFGDAVGLLESRELAAIGRAADAVTRRLHPEPYRTYNIDRNINYTNVCTAVCDFCAFYRGPKSPEGYVLDRDVLLKKIEETVALGGDQILMQGGLHPTLPLEWYEELLRDIKSHFPQVNIHGFSPPEIHHFTKVSNRPLPEVLERLARAGLGSLPGGGGEILVDRVRAAITRGKVMTDDWLEVHRQWHLLGGKSTATMMYGQPDNTEMDDVPPAGPFEYLKTQAVARLYLDNFPNIQSSWVTQGREIGQLALLFGANDMGSLMIEENVVSAAGTVHHLTLDEMKAAISELGWVPRRRNVFYELFEEEPEVTLPPAADARPGFVPLPVATTSP